MRRSFWFTAALTAVLGVALPGRALPARAESQNLLSPSGNQGGILSGSVNSAPFQETGATEQGNPPAKTKKQWVNPGETPSPPSVSPEGHRSLGSLFELKRQETLLKREIAIKKLKDQLKGPIAKKILDTGTHGSPMTLLAAGIDGNRYAVIEWPDGRRIRVREGENLPDGTRVIRIDGSGVSVKKRGSTVTYPYGETSGTGQGGGIPQFSGFSAPPRPQGMTGGHP